MKKRLFLFAFLPKLGALLAPELVLKKPANNSHWFKKPTRAGSHTVFCRLNSQSLLEVEAAQSNFAEAVLCSKPTQIAI